MPAEAVPKSIRQNKIRDGKLDICYTDKVKFG